MLKKILSLVIAVLMCLSVCACGSDSTTSDESTASSGENASNVSSSTASKEEEKTADAVITVTAKKGEIKKFKSDRPYDKSKKDISLILVVGQSNFTTGVGFSGEYAHYLNGKTDVIPEAPTLPVAGTVYSGSTVTALTDDRDVAQLADVSRIDRVMGGVSPAFGAKWHELTGTTVVFVQAAVGAVGMHEWTPDPTIYSCKCTHNGNNLLYANAVTSYKTSYDALSKDYNIVYTGYIWNQGEHDEVYGKDPENTVSSDAIYYAAYKSMHEGFMNDLKLDFGGISVTRADKQGGTAQSSMCLTIARSAQYQLCEDISDLYMLSTIAETCPHSMMDQSNTIHYAQKTFNLMGADCAENLGRYLGVTEASAFDGLKVYSSAGNLVESFDANGAVSADSNYKGFVPKGILTDHLLTKVGNLGNGYTFGGYKLTVGDKDMTNCIDEFGKLDWDTILKEKKVKTVQLKCVIE